MMSLTLETIVATEERREHLEPVPSSLHELNCPLFVSEQPSSATDSHDQGHYVGKDGFAGGCNCGADLRRSSASDYSANAEAPSSEPAGYSRASSDALQYTPQSSSSSVIYTL